MDARLTSIRTKFRDAELSEILHKTPRALLGVTPDAEKALSEPVRAPAGYAVIRVLEKKPFDQAEFEKQKPILRSNLKQQRRAELFRAFLIAARDRYTIERNAEAFKRALGQEQ